MNSLVDSGLRYAGAIPGLARRQASTRADRLLYSLALLERSALVRRLTDLCLTGIRVEPIPQCLAAGQGAILVSNYPSVSEAMRAVIKVGCRLPGDRLRLKAISRPEVVTNANPLMKALGVTRRVFPVQKNEHGAYRLDRRVLAAVLAYLDGPGNVLWLSITGRTRANGLLEGDARTGAAQFAVKKGLPLVPMALVTRPRGTRLTVAEIRFGEPILPPQNLEFDESARVDMLLDLSRLAMCQIATLLPPEQRGDFVDVEEKLAEVQARITCVAPAPASEPPG